jgi:hypothetical protein
MVNRWFTKYLWGQDNGVENLPKSWVVRESESCPPRETTVTGDQSNTATLAVASSAAFMVGQTLTVPQTNADGTTSNTSRPIIGIPDATHVTLDRAIATNAGQKVADGAVVGLSCGNSNPTPYAEWPDPASARVTQKLLPGGNARGTLGFGAASAGTTEALTDDATIAATTLRDAQYSPNRLIYQTNPLTEDVRISGTPTVSLRVAFSQPAANLSAALISYPADGGDGTILTRGWKDPQNRNSDYVTEPMTPGEFYTVSFGMQAKDAVVPAGNRLALMVFSSDRNYTIRPAPGTEVTLDLAGSSFDIPVVGGASGFAQATGTGYAELPVGGDVPPTLSLTLGSPASFGSFVPGVADDYTASTTATVTSTAGDATLSSSDPGHLTNGPFALLEPLQVAFSRSTWDGPVSNDPVTITFTQSIGANEPLRTGSYSKTLTFTLSTTTP